MPLIRCEDCGKQISDKSKACVHCGCPVSAKNSQTRLDELIRTHNNQSDIRNNYRQNYNNSAISNYVIAPPAERFIAYILDYLIQLPMIIISIGVWIYFEINYFEPYYVMFVGYVYPDINYAAISIWSFSGAIYGIIILIIQIGYCKKGTSF